MNIAYLKQRDIDKEKWDACLRRADNALIYANSWYLDIVSPDWEALVCGDYKAVFPLTARRKLGIPYLAHPLFAQQLGLFYGGECDKSIDDFLRQIPSKYKLGQMRLNYANRPKEFSYGERKNYILYMTDSGKLESNFNQNTKRNLKKASESLAVISQDVDIQAFVELKKKHSKAKLSDAEWERMAELIRAVKEREAGFFKAIFIDGRLISAVFYTNWKERICYLFSASSEEGKDIRASFSLVHDVLSHYEGSGKVLDFEGSMDVNVARFFQGFGAEQEVYFELKKWY